MIPSSSKIYQSLEALAQNSKLVAFTGLPGVGKSLYVKQFTKIVQKLNRPLTVIQWDMARKSFETPEIFKQFPMGDGTVHNGVKVSVGKWFVYEIDQWRMMHGFDDHLLLIEAPLVGHRFIELVTPSKDEQLEHFLSNEVCQIIAPIPSIELRKKIEADRMAQLDDNATQWIGAKPSVMLMLWKMICGIANEMGKEIEMDGQPPYDPSIYEFVFSNILKHRHFVPLHVDEIFNIDISDESELAVTDSLVATAEQANYYAELVNQEYDESSLHELVNKWYKN